MTLSEAIRLGATVAPQGFGPDSCEVTNPGMCAFGAAKIAMGFSGHGHFEVNRRWPWLITGNWQCPVTGHSDTAGMIIWKLNDLHRWTRERIAAWVATIEPPEPAEAPAAAGEIELVAR